MTPCCGCQSPVGCAGADLCLTRNHDALRSLEAAKRLLAGQICGCERADCPKVADALRGASESAVQRPEAP